MEEQVIKKIQENLTPDLLKPEYRGADIPYLGHCYVAAEALYHALGAAESEWTPVRARDSEGITHWWLEDEEGHYLDPTADQYRFRGVEPPYEKGRRAGFLTKAPSRRAQILLDRIQPVSEGNKA